MRFTPLLSLILASFAAAQGSDPQALAKNFHPRPFPALEARLGGQWLAQWTVATNTPRVIYGTGAPLADWRGNTIDEARRHALAALRDHGDLLGLGTSEFRESIGARMGRTWSFKFDQFFRGLPCIDGRADVRINMKGVLAMIGSTAWQVPADFDITPKLGEVEATARAWMALDQLPTGVPQPGKQREPRLVIWGDVHAQDQAPFYLAWEVPVSNVDAEGRGPIGRYYIDAKTGQTLTFVTDKHECGIPGCGINNPVAERDTTNGESAFVPTTVTVMAWSRVAIDAQAALTNNPLPGLQLNVPGVGAVTTDDNGQFTIDIASPVNVTLGALDGRHHVAMIGGNAPTGSYTITPGAANTIQIGANSNTPEQAAHVTTSYWIDVTNEFSRSILGNSAELAQASNITPTVNIASTCNAYYTGNTINFYAAGGGCANTAFSTVISHEWGHGIDERYGGISNTVAEGVSEGWGDIFGLYIMDTPLLGSGFQTAGTALRRGDNNNSYPFSTTSPHGAGQVWMGFAWRLRENLRAAFGTQQAIAISNDIVISSIVADATTRPDCVTQVFIADDDDGNLLNGTPHYAQLSAAAIAKNLPYPQFAPITIQHTALGDTGDRFNSRVVTAQGIANDAGTITSMQLVYQVAGGPQLTRAMVTDGTASGYRAMLPGLSSGQVSYHIESTSTTGTSRYPATGEISYTVSGSVGGTFTPFYNEGFETGGPGWTHQQILAQDDWQVGDPNGRSGTSLGIAWADPQNAATGTNSYGNDLGNVIGTTNWNGAYAANVHNVLFSPSIDCSGRTGVTLRFKRWLTVEEAIYDQAQILCNGQLVWQNPDLGNLVDTSWQTFEYALPMADNNSNVQIEFRLITDPALQLGGWNIDDLELGTRAVIPLDGTLQMTPEQSSAGQPVQLAIDTNGASKIFILVFGDTGGPTSVPGFPTASVGGTLDYFAGISGPTGLYSLSFASPGGLQPSGFLLYSQVLIFEPDGTFSLSNQFKNLLVQ